MLLENQIQVSYADPQVLEHTMEQFLYKYLLVFIQRADLISSSTLEWWLIQT